MKSIVKNELWSIVQHDTIICEPYRSGVYHQTKYGKVWWWLVFKNVLYGMLVSGRNKINLKNMTINFI